MSDFGPFSHALVPFSTLQPCAHCSLSGTKGTKQRWNSSKPNSQIIVFICSLWWFLKYPTYKGLWKALTYSWDSNKRPSTYTRLYTCSERQIGSKLCTRKWELRQNFQPPYLVLEVRPKTRTESLSKDGETYFFQVYKEILVQSASH